MCLPGPQRLCGGIHPSVTCREAWSHCVSSVVPGPLSCLHRSVSPWGWPLYTPPVLHRAAAGCILPTPSIHGHALCAHSLRGLAGLPTANLPTPFALGVSAKPACPAHLWSLVSACSCSPSARCFTLWPIRLLLGLQGGLLRLLSLPALPVVPFDLEAPSDSVVRPRVQGILGTHPAPRQPGHPQRCTA